MPKIKPLYQKLFLFSFLISIGIVAGLRNISFAGSLTDVSVTMSNSRLSYLGELASAAGAETKIEVNETIGYVDGNDQHTDVLKVNDTLNFDTDTVNVTEIVDDDELIIDSALTTDNTSGSTFYMSETTNLSVAFTTATAVTGSATELEEGYFRILVPARADDANDYHSDGEPDSGYFDFGSGTTASISCPTDADPDGDTTNEYDFPPSGTANANNGTVAIDGQEYHFFTCNYSGDGYVGTSLSLTISDLINPAPDSDHDTGTADTYSIIVQQMDGNGTNLNQNDDTVVDQTTVKIGTIEAVKLSAEVVPSLTFTVSGIDHTTVGDTEGLGQVCGLDNSNGDSMVTTTPDAIPFGEVDTGTFVHGIQELFLTTNAVDGASVTAAVNDQPGLNGGACAGDTYNAGANAYTCIWDANVASMDQSTTQDWGTTVNSTNHGYGYALDDLDSDTTEAFAYDGGGTWMARHYADTAEGQNPVELFNTASQPTNGDDVYVCTRLIPDALTSAGYYYNYITYIATAQF